MEKKLFHVELVKTYIDSQKVNVVSKEKQDLTDIVYPCHLFLDQAQHTGFVIADDAKRLVLVGHLTMSKKEDTTAYKFALQEYLIELIKEYKISHIWHEEVFLQKSHHTTEVLNYIKHGIKDINYLLSKESDDYAELKILGLDNGKWKKALAAPGKFKVTGDVKKEVAKYVSTYFPLLMFEEIEDIIDALGMMIAVSLKTKGTNKPFQARINKKLPVHAEMILIPNGMSFEDIIPKLRKPYRQAFESYGAYEYAFNTAYNEIMNSRYALSYRDGLCFSKVPDYRNLGERLLANGLAPKDIAADETLYVVAVKK